MLAFVVWWAVTLTWSPSRIYGPEKLFYLATLAYWGLIVGALIIGPDPERVRRLFTLLLLFATWVGIESLLLYREDPTLLHLHKRADEYHAFNNYQQIGRMAGLGALVAFTAWLFGRRLSVGNLLFLVLCAMLTFVLMTTGGKGAILATAACILLALLVGLRVTRRKILYKRYQLSIIWLVVGLVAGLSICCCHLRAHAQISRASLRHDRRRRVPRNRGKSVRRVPGRAQALAGGAGTWSWCRQLAGYMGRV